MFAASSQLIEPGINVQGLCRFKTQFFFILNFHTQSIGNLISKSPDLSYTIWHVTVVYQLYGFPFVVKIRQFLAIGIGVHQISLYSKLRDKRMHSSSKTSSKSIVPKPSSCKIGYIVIHPCSLSSSLQPTKVAIVPTRSIVYIRTWKTLAFSHFLIFYQYKCLLSVI